MVLQVERFGWLEKIRSYHVVYSAKKNSGLGDLVFI